MSTELELKEGQSQLPYRQTSAAVIFNKSGEFLLIQKSRYQDDQFEWPGGGVEEGETTTEAALREVREEVGIVSSLAFVGVSTTTNTYEWEQSVSESYFASTGKWYRGVEQSFVLLRFNGDKKRMSLQKDEIKRAVWVPREKLSEYLVFPNQARVAERILYNPPIAGTEIYGLKPGQVEAEVLIASPDFRTKSAIVLDPAGMLRMQVIREGEITPDEVPLPRFFNSVDDLRKRPPLRVWDELSPPDRSKDVVSEMLNGIDYWVWLTHPGYRAMTKVKVYEEYRSGQSQLGGKPESHYFYVPVYGLRNAVARKIAEYKKITGKNWTGGFAGEVQIVPNDEFEAIERTDHLPSSTIIPLFDFDIQFSEDSKKEIGRIKNILSSNGISGWLVSSGRGLHLICDFLIPRSELHRYLGLFAMLTLPSNKEFAIHKKLARKLYQARSEEDVVSVAEEIRQKIPNSDSASVADMRYVAQQVLRGTPVLRTEPYWNSPSTPSVIARII